MAYGKCQECPKFFDSGKIPNYCPECGKTVIQRCPHCNFTLDELGFDARPFPKFCINCGFELLNYDPVSRY